MIKQILDLMTDRLLVDVRFIQRIYIYIYIKKSETGTRISQGIVARRSTANGNDSQIHNIDLRLAETHNTDTRLKVPCS